MKRVSPRGELRVAVERAAWANFPSRWAEICTTMQHAPWPLLVTRRWTRFLVGSSTSCSSTMASFADHQGDCRAYFQDLTDEVEDPTGQRDHSLTLRVTEVLGVDPAGWFQRRFDSVTKYRKNRHVN